MRMVADQSVWSKALQKRVPVIRFHQTNTPTPTNTTLVNCYTIPENRCVAFSCSLKYTQTPGQKKLEKGASVSEELAKQLARRLVKIENGGGSVGIEQGTQETRSGPEVQTNTQQHTHTSQCSSIVYRE